jgi:hypothetical protein
MLVAQPRPHAVVILVFDQSRRVVDVLQTVSTVEAVLGGHPTELIAERNIPCVAVAYNRLVTVVTEEHERRDTSIAGSRDARFKLSLSALVVLLLTVEPAVVPVVVATVKQLLCCGDSEDGEPRKDEQINKLEIPETAATAKRLDVEVGDGAQNWNNQKPERGERTHHSKYWSDDQHQQRYE